MVPQAALWIIFAAFIGTSNDVFVRLIGDSMATAHIAFFRFFFSALLLLPTLIARPAPRFHLHKPSLHIIRAILGIVPLSLATYAAARIPLPQIATIFYSIPLFSLLFSKLLLHEGVNKQRILAAIIGFSGTLIATNPNKLGWLNTATLALLGAAVLFALSDVIIRKMLIEQEDTPSMLFHFACCGVIITLPFLWLTPFHWSAITSQQWLCLLSLGLGANLIQLGLFKAYSYSEVSALIPLRYTDLLFSTLFEMLLFHKPVELATYIGACLIIPPVIYIAYNDRKRANRESNSHNSSVNGSSANISSNSSASQ